MIKLQFLSLLLSVEIVSVSPWSTVSQINVNILLTSDQLLNNIFYFVHIASLWALELFSLIIIYFYFLYHLLKKNCGNTTFAAIIFALFFIGQFCFNCFYFSGLFWSIEFWYGNFFSFSFIEYLASDIRIFFTTIILILFFLLQNFLIHKIKNFYTHSYVNQVNSEFSEILILRTWLPFVRAKLQNLIMYSSLVLIGYFYFPTLDLNTFHWYSNISWTFNYNFLQNNDIDWYIGYKQLYSLLSIFCLFFYMIINTLRFSVNYPKSNKNLIKQQKITMFLTLPIVQPVNVNGHIGDNINLPYFSYHKQALNLFNKKKIPNTTYNSRRELSMLSNGNGYNYIFKEGFAKSLETNIYASGLRIHPREFKVKLEDVKLEINPSKIEYSDNTILPINYDIQIIPSGPDLAPNPLELNAETNSQPVPSAQEILLNLNIDHSTPINVSDTGSLVNLSEIIYRDTRLQKICAKNSHGSELQQFLASDSIDKIEQKQAQEKILGCFNDLKVIEDGYRNVVKSVKLIVNYDREILRTYTDKQLFSNIIGTKVTTVKDLDQIVAEKSEHITEMIRILALSPEKPISAAIFDQFKSRSVLTIEKPFNFLTYLNKGADGSFQKLSHICLQDLALVIQKAVHANIELRIKFIDELLKNLITHEFPTGHTFWQKLAVLEKKVRLAKQDCSHQLSLANEKPIPKSQIPVNSLTEFHEAFENLEFAGYDYFRETSETCLNVINKLSVFYFKTKHHNGTTTLDNLGKLVTWFDRRINEPINVKHLNLDYNHWVNLYKTINLQLQAQEYQSFIETCIKSHIFVFESNKLRSINLTEFFTMFKPQVGTNPKKVLTKFTSDNSLHLVFDVRKEHTIKFSEAISFVEQKPSIAINSNPIPFNANNEINLESENLQTSINLGEHNSDLLDDVGMLRFVGPESWWLEELYDVVPTSVKTGFTIFIEFLSHGLWPW